MRTPTFRARSFAGQYVILPLCLVLAACAGILGIKPKTGERPFEHRAHTTKGVACTVCHAGIAKALTPEQRAAQNEVRLAGGHVAAAAEGGAHTEAGVPLVIPGRDVCVKCHEKPHNADNCMNCHGERTTRDATELVKSHLRFDHDTHRVASNGRCTKCHIAAGESRDVPLMAPMSTCFGCHPHDKDFDSRRCEACHVDLPAERVTPQSHLVHDGDFEREHGIRAAASRDICTTCHTQRFCLGCHGVGTTPGLPARMTFDDPKLTGLHRAGFQSRHAEESRNAPTMCLTCHTENTCKDCHERQNVAAGGGAKRSPHPANWMFPPKGSEHGRAARLDPMSCAACHSGAGEQLCIGCHKVGGSGGNPHGPDFESDKSKMNDLPCRNCHRVNP